MQELSYNMDVEPLSKWLYTTPGAVMQKQPYICTEAGIFYGRQHFFTARTNKDSYILFYTLKGAGLIEQGDNQVILSEGQALLMNCRTPQSYCTAPQKTCWHHYWVHIDGTGVEALEELLIPNKKITPINVLGIDAKSCLESILENIEVNTVYSVTQIGLDIHKLLTYMFHSQLSESESSSARKMILDAAEFIRNNYRQPLRLDELVDKAHLSKSYFMRLFRQYMGTTPYNYLLCQRISQAKELLIMTDLPINIISENVGFTNESNFSTRFTLMTGQSPLQYRKSVLTLTK